MNEKKSKRIRRTAQRVFDRNALTAIFKYVDRLCREPFRVRLAYAWKFVRGINPHTGERVERNLFRGMKPIEMNKPEPGSIADRVEKNVLNVLCLFVGHWSLHPVSILLLSLRFSTHGEDI